MPTTFRINICLVVLSSLFQVGVEAQERSIQNSCAADLQRANPNSLDPKYVRFPPDNLEDPLPSWNYAEIVGAATKFSSERVDDKVKEIQLLAWHASVDVRPLYLNMAFIVVVLENKFGAQRWMLMHLAQNPIPGCGSQVGWGPYYITDIPWKPIRVFDYRPTSEEVEAFLVQWKHHTSHSFFRTLTAGIRPKSWERVLGTPPIELGDLIAQ